MIQIGESVIHYQELKRWKYRIKKTAVFQTPIRPAADIITEYVNLYTDGRLEIKPNYCFDGPSGPTIDRAKAVWPLGANLRGSLPHDALYGLGRAGLLGPECRDIADEILREVWLEDKMAGWIAATEVAAVKRFASSAYEIDPHPEPPILEAP